MAILKVERGYECRVHIRTGDDVFDTENQNLLHTTVEDLLKAIAALHLTDAIVGRIMQGRANRFEQLMDKIPGVKGD